MGWGSSLWGTDEWPGSTASTGDFTFDCTEEDFGTNKDRPGVVVITLNIKPSNFTHVSDAIVITVSPSADYIQSFVSTDSTITITVRISPRGGDVSISLPSSAGWIWTSRIGIFDFDFHESGETVRMPMSHSGLINKIMKLGRSVIVYADMGVTRMTAHGIDWGRDLLHDVGVISKNGATGTDDIQYFVDKTGMLYKLRPESLPEKMDYSDRMSALTSDTVLSYDVRRDIVYITDGTLGFTLTQDGLGQCPPNITGVGWRAGSFYTVAPDAITNSPFGITTDIIDFGVRTEKTIDYIGCSVDLSENLYVAVDYRWSKDDSWSTTPWRKTDFRGRASFMVTATEFRIKVKLTTYEDIRLDDIIVYGKYPDGKPIKGLGIQ